MKYDKYIGLPYKDNGRDIDGIDCWGLVRLYYKEELGIDLPSYTTEYYGRSDPDISSLVNLYKDNWEKTTEYAPGDVIVFNMLGEPSHVGVYIDNNKFIHCRSGANSVVESLTSSKWTKRIEGVYKYSTKNQVQLVGAPHPLKSSIVFESSAAGKTVQEVADFITQKYAINSTQYTEKLVILVDGVPVQKDLWATTVLKAGEVVTYKAVAGEQVLKMVIVFVAVFYLGPMVGNFLAGGTAAAGSFAAAAGKFAVAIAASALVNAIFPVRQPTVNDPGNSNPLNVFTGTSNQENRFGAIPVVLGKVRMSGLLGATPYIETLSDTTLLNLLIVWGFGPLAINDICIGANQLENYYTGLALETPRPVTLYGTTDQDETSFNALYGSDVEQAPAKQVELVNLEADNPWQYIYFNQESTRVAVSFTAPEGMRAVNTKNGDVSETTAKVSVELGVYNPATAQWIFSPQTPYSLGAYNSNQLDPAAFTTTLPAPGGNTTDVPMGDTTVANYVPYHQFFTFAIAPTGGVQIFDGIVYSNPNGVLTSSEIAAAEKSNYGWMLEDISAKFSTIPVIPQDFLPIHTVLLKGSGEVESTISYLSQYSMHEGLGLTVTQLTEAYQGEFNTTVYSPSGYVKFDVQAGYIIKNAASNVVTEDSGLETETIFTSRQFIGKTNAEGYSGWTSLLNNYGIASNDGNKSGTSLDYSQTVYFPYSGQYLFETSADDSGEVIVDGITIIKALSWREVQSTLHYLEKGNHTVRLKADNSGGGLIGGSLVVKYTRGGINTVAKTYTEIVFGAPGLFHKRKDAGGYTQYFEQLPKARYAIRCKRTNSSIEEQGDLRYLNKIVLFTAACFDNTRPAVNPPGCWLAKTAIKVQSTNKINGSIEGVNALVQSICLDWDKATQTWINRPTSNPASLFMHVLMHPANAYAIKNTEWRDKIDLATLQDWHEFCDTGNSSGGKLEYNNTLTNNMSIIDVLRDICAAGLASPLFIDGKWSVVVDKPRPYTTQYFTPYNSWDFESTKTLLRLPHAFRINLLDEQQAYQTNELIVYNYGYNKDGTSGKEAATLFESLTLPGVTNKDQAKFLARWHHAQIKLRPETYSINTDFEYLVCNRGDVVKVSHDVPLWGVGSGRIKAVTVGSTALQLTEPMKLTAGKTYSILIRTNDKTKPDGITKTLAPITITDFYTTIQLSDASIIQLSDGIEPDNLFMLGELDRVTQELVVLSIEPTSSTGAKLTLVDYSPEIYTADLDQLLTFDANITLDNTDIVKNTITQAPIINQVSSESALSEAISGGTYQNVVIVSFSSPMGLSQNAEQIESQIIRADSDFDSSSLSEIYTVDKSISSLVVNGLTTDSTYKMRSRYSSKSGLIVGPWSEIFWFLNSGKTVNGSLAPTLEVDLEGTFIVAKPAVTTQMPDFLTYEYRLRKDTGTEDFWELDISDPQYGIKIVKSTGDARFDLREQPRPRLSAAGVTYRIACRALDRQGNYSTVSTLGTIVVKTIT
jgi:hypothetical protein